MARGMNSAGSTNAVLFNSSQTIVETADGRDTNAIWSEFQETIRMRNSARTAVQRLFTFDTTDAARLIPQTTSLDRFEEASEFGEPVGVASAPEMLTIGIPHRWYDLGSRFTWKFLLEADARQIEAIHSQVLEADSLGIFEQVMGRLLSPGTSYNDEGHPVYGLYNGDGFVPPATHEREFTGSHTHYLTTHGKFDGLDLEDAIEHITEHEYGTTPGSRLLVFAHPAQGKVIRRFRANEVVNEGGGIFTSYDFVPSTGAPAHFALEDIVGEQAPSEYNGLSIIGSFGPALVSETRLLPPGYVVVVATGGQGSELNPVALRQHRRPNMQGLQLLPGNNNAYPLTESFYRRGFGVGVAHRGAAVVIQDTSSAVYTPPSAYPRPRG